MVFSGEDFFFVSEHAEAWKLLYPKDRINLLVFTGLFMYWIYPCIPFSCKWFKAIKQASSILSHWTWSPSKSQNTLGIYFWKQLQLTIFLEHLHVWKKHQPQFPFQRKRRRPSFSGGSTPQVVAKHGGELSVKSQPGKGSTFRPSVQWWSGPRISTFFVWEIFVGGRIFPHICGVWLESTFFFKSFWDFFWVFCCFPCEKQKTKYLRIVSSWTWQIWNVRVLF